MLDYNMSKIARMEYEERVRSYLQVRDFEQMNQSIRPNRILKQVGQVCYAVGTGLVSLSAHIRQEASSLDTLATEPAKSTTN